MIFYLISVALSLYMVWLLMFRTYHLDAYGKPTDKVRMPNVCYVLLFIVSFVPIANIMLFFVFIIITLIGRYCEECFYVKSWLFDTLGEKEEKEES